MNFARSDEIKNHWEGVVMEVVKGLHVHVDLVQIELDEPRFRRSQPFESRLLGEDDCKVGEEARTCNQ